MSEVSTNQEVRVGLISLGCAKNLVDAEIMLGTLLKDGSRSPMSRRRPTW